MVTTPLFFLFPPLRDLVKSQRTVAITTTPSRNFFSTFLTQGRRTPGKTQHLNCVSAPSLSAVARKEPTTNPVRTSIVEFMLNIVRTQNFCPALFVNDFVLCS